MRNNLLIVNDEIVDFEILTESREGTIIIEHLFDETYQALLSAKSRSRSTRSYGPAQVPDDHFFVLGDNRDNSADSRVYNFIPRDQIVGRSSSVVFSMDSEHTFRPRSGRFMAQLN
jgi:signal peptidase I